MLKSGDANFAENSNGELQRSFQIWPCLFCLQYLSLRPDPPRNDWPALGQPGPPSPHFYRQGPGPARPPNRSLLSTGIPHFYRRGPASPASNPSLLLARPLTSISQTPHLYWPSPHGQVMAILGHPRESFRGLRLRLTPVCRHKMDTARCEGSLVIVVKSRAKK